MQAYKSKIIGFAELLKQRQRWKQQGELVVLTNGCFDILHRGHIDYLYKAAALGTKLIVAVNSDSSVKDIKKPGRPIQDEHSRSEIIAALACVDTVILFSESTPLKLIEALLPDVLVKGSDYKADDIVGYKEVVNNGGEVTTIGFLNGYSTTLIEERILRSSFQARNLSKPLRSQL